MDYKRVYAEFIKDRREKEAHLEGYSEKHHIVPRCMGGGDESENLIRLTAEDHYFSHLLLAKAYGGRNWAAVYAMAHLVIPATKDRLGKLRRRVAFGHVRRSLAGYYREILSGPDGKIADKVPRELMNFDGRRVYGNRFELEIATGIPRPQISAVLRGAKGSSHGWYCPVQNSGGLTPQERFSKAARSDRQWKLYHFDGREWTGTQSEFMETFGRALVFQHPQGCVAGWYRMRDHAQQLGSLRDQVVRKASAARGDISGRNNPNADPTKYQFIVLATSEIISATKVEIKERFGATSVDLCALFSGKQKIARGVSLVVGINAGAAQYRLDL